MNFNSKKVLKKIMSLTLSLIMILSSIIGTGVYNMEVAHAADYKKLSSVVSWNFDDEVETTSGRADEKYITAENLFELATKQMSLKEPGKIVTIKYSNNLKDLDKKDKMYTWAENTTPDLMKDNPEICGAKLEADKEYWIKFSGITLSSGRKVTVKMTVSKPMSVNNNSNNYGSDQNDGGPYIVFFKNQAGTVRWSGFKRVRCDIDIFDTGDSDTLSNEVYADVSIMDIDQNQAIRIKDGCTSMIVDGDHSTVGKKLLNGTDSDLEKGYKDYLTSIGDVTDDQLQYCFACNNFHDEDNDNPRNAYSFATRLHFTPSKHQFTYWFYSGRNDVGYDYGAQTSGVLMWFAQVADDEVPIPVPEPPIVTKKVNGVDDYTLTSGGETVTYTLSSYIDQTVADAAKAGTFTLQSFGWTDALQNVLAYGGNWSVTRDGVDVTSQFTNGSSGQNISVMMNDPGNNIAGGTYTLAFTAKVKDGADLSGYVQANGYAKIPNTGTVHFRTAETQKATSSNSNTVNIYWKPAVRPNPTKSVTYNGTTGDSAVLNDADDSWTYTITQKMPADTWPYGYMDKFVITDQIDECLVIDKGSIKVTSGSQTLAKDSQYTLSTDGNKVIVSLTQAAMNDNSLIYGRGAEKDIKVTFNVSFNKDYSYRLKSIKKHAGQLTLGNGYSHVDGGETVVTMNNNATVQTAWDAWHDGWNETKTTQTVSTTVDIPTITVPEKVVSDEDETEKASNTLTDADEVWTYKITQKIPAHTASIYRYSSFNITDQIDECLTIGKKVTDADTVADDIVVKIDGKEMSRTDMAVSVSDSNLVTVTPSDSLLQGGSSNVFYGQNNAGSTITVEIPVHIYAGGDEGGSDASNQAKLEEIRKHGHFNNGNTETSMTFTNKAVTTLDDMIDRTPQTAETGTVTTTVAVPQIKAPTKYVSDMDDLNWEHQVGKQNEKELDKNNRISDSAREWIYTIKQEIPAHSVPLFFYKSFNFQDKVDTCLEYDPEDAIVMIGDTVVGRDYFTVERNEETNLFTVTATDKALKDPDLYGYGGKVDSANPGTTITVQFPVHIKVDEDKPYDTSVLKAHNHLKKDDQGHDVYEFINGDEERETKTVIDNLVKVNGNMENDITTAADERKTDSVVTQVEVSEPQIEKKADRFEWEVGEDVKYSITVKNNNPYSIMDRVVITDTDLPDSLQLDKDAENAIMVYAEGATDNFSAPGNEEKIPAPRGLLTETEAGSVTGAAVPWWKEAADDSAQIDNITKQCEVTYYNDQGDTGNGFSVMVPKQYRGETITLTFICRVTEDYDDCIYRDTNTCSNGSIVENTASVSSTNMLEDEPLTDTERIWINTPHLAIEKYTGSWNYSNGKFQREDADENQTNYKPGDTVHYTLLVKNDHPGTLARDVMVTDEMIDEGLQLNENSIEVHKIKLDADGNPAERYGQTGTTRLTQGTDYTLSTYGDKAFEIFFTGRNLRYWGKTPFSANVDISKIHNGKYETGAADDTKIPGLKKTDEGTYNQPDRGTIKYRDDIAYGQDDKGNITGGLADTGSMWLTDKSFANTWERYPVGYQTANENGVAGDTENSWKSIRTVNHPKEWKEADTAYIISYEATVTRGVSLKTSVKNEVYADAENALFVKGDASITFRGAKLAIEKTSDKDVYSVGNTGKYVLKVTETQEEVIAKNVVIKDSVANTDAKIDTSTIKVTYYSDKSKFALDKNFLPVGGSDVTDGCKFPSDSNSDEEIYIMTRSNLDNKGMFVVTYDMDFGNEKLADKTVPNTAMAKADNAYPELSEYTPWIRTTGDLAMRKSSDPYSGVLVQKEDTISYTIGVRNTGGTDLYNILVKDQIPELTQYVDGSAYVFAEGNTANKSGGYAKLISISGKDTVAAVIPTLHAYETKYLTFQVTVSEEATDDDEIWNIAALYDAADEEIPKNTKFSNTEDFEEDILALFAGDRFVQTNETVHPLSYWAVDDNVVRVIDNGDTVEKSADKNAYYVGETITYTAQYSLTTDGAHEDNVIVEDNVKGSDLIELTGVDDFKIYWNGEDISDEMRDKIVINDANDGFTIDMGREITYKDVIKIVYKAKALPGAAEAELGVTNSISFNNNPALETITVTDSSLRISKEVDPVNLKIGQEASYHVEVTEATDRGEITNLVIEDALEEAGLIKVLNDESHPIIVKWNNEDITKDVTITADENGYKVETGRTLTIKDKVTVDYTGIPTDAAVQYTKENGQINNTAYAYSADDPDEKVSATAFVKVTDDPNWLKVEKSSDKEIYGLTTAKMLKKEDLTYAAHYTVKVSNLKDGVARSVDISDAFELTGMKIDPDTVKIVLTNNNYPDGTDITKDVEFTSTDNSYEIKTGRDLGLNDFFTVTYDVTFQDEALVGQDIVNIAKAKASNVDEVQDDNTVHVIKPEPTVEKSAGKPKYHVGETGHYTIKAGQVQEGIEALNVVIKDQLSALVDGFYIVDGSIKVTDNDGNDITESVKAITVNDEKTGFEIETGRNLAYGQFLTVEYDVAFDSMDLVGNDVENTAIVSCDNAPDKSAEEKVTITEPPVLSIEKTSDKSVYKLGETGKYTVVVKQTKEDVTAKNVLIDDTMQMKGAKIQPDTIRIADTAGNDITGEVKITADEQKYLIETGKDLAYNETFTVTYDVLFEDAALVNKAIVNIARAKADNTMVVADNSAKVPPTEITENLTAVKTSDPASGTQVKNGQEITYHVTLEGKEGVMFLDAIPELSSFVEGSIKVEREEDSSLLKDILSRLTGDDETGDSGSIVTIGEKQYVAAYIPKLDGKAVVSFTVKVSENATEDDTIRNVALVKTPEKDDNTEDPSTWVPDDFVPTNEVEHPLDNWVSDDETVTVINEQPVLHIEKSSDKEQYMVGETGHYTVVVSQTKEEQIAKHVVIKDELQMEGADLLGDTIRIFDNEGTDITKAVEIEHTGSSYQIDTGSDLAFGEKFTVTYDVTFTSKDLANKTVVNIARAKADNAYAETDNEVIPVIVEENLTALKSSDPVSGTVVKAGQDITYHIAVTNDGTADKKNVYVMDAIPELTSYVEGSGGEIRTIGEKDYVTFVIPQVAAGTTETVSFTVKVSEKATKDDIIKNVALVRPSSEEEPADPWNPDDFVPTNKVEHPLDNWVSDDVPVDIVDEDPVLAIEKASDKDTYAVGETGHYTVVVKQTKENAKAEKVVIKDALQTEGAKILAETILIKDTNGEDITQDVQITPADTSYQIDTGKDLAFDETFTVTYDVLFESADLAGKSVKNIAQAEAGEIKAETEKEVNIDQGEKARLVVTKASDKDTYDVGETGTYVLTVTNDREGTRAENIVLDDAFELTGMVIDKDSVVAKDADGNVIEGATVTLNDKENGFNIKTGTSLDGGKSLTVTYKVQFKDDALAGKDVKNTVVASSDNTDPATADNVIKIKEEAPKDTTSDEKKTSTSEKKSSPDQKTSTVKTSDVLVIVLIAAVVILLGTVVVYIRKRRR